MLGRKGIKIVASFLSINLLLDCVAPALLFGLTGGPGQPEVQAFQAAGTDQMVDPFTGDFNYSIPLLDVGGYPLALGYQSGVGMEQEASWVGLGWNLSVGSVTRNMRGLPDDFKGDRVVKQQSMRPNRTYGAKAKIGYLELFGVQLLGSKNGKGKVSNSKFMPGIGLSWNNYNGFGFEMSMNPTIQAGKGSKKPLTLGLGLSSSSESGVGVSPSISLSGKEREHDGNKYNLSTRVGLSFNSQAGLSALNVSGSLAGSSGDVKDKSASLYGGSISFAGMTFSPKANFPMVNSSVSISATLGGSLFGGHLAGNLTGYYSGQKQQTTELKFSAYGYQNMHLGTLTNRGLLDFNREKDGPFMENTPALPLTNLTYDTYTISGQGTGGMFRAHRSDVGMVHDPYVQDLSNGFDLGGLEFGFGGVAHNGLNMNFNTTISNQGPWRDQRSNQMIKSVKFTGYQESDLDYEPFYFKKSGEMSAETNPAFFAATGGFDEVKVALNSNVPEGLAMNKLTRGRKNEPLTMSGKLMRSKRQARNEGIIALDAKEAAAVGFIKAIENYPVNQFDFATDADITKPVDEVYKHTYMPARESRSKLNIHDQSLDHHTSEFVSVQNGGTRYVYGLPAFNKRTEEVTFSVKADQQGTDASMGLTGYATGSDDTKNNGVKPNQYFSNTITPDYAHSYMLTGVLSADYVDVTGDGPSPDDLGDYTKFNYSRTEDSYKWRVPYHENKASFQEGIKMDALDDKAGYVYGEKELYYIHSIETKNYVAEFHTKDRLDARGVKGRHGGFDANLSGKMKYLDKVVLFSRADKLKETLSTNGYKATPIKTVEFDYSYELCQGVPNGVTGATYTDKDGVTHTYEGGKLTLKKVYFTYAHSMKGKLNSYDFVYGDENDDDQIDAALNPDYNPKGFDRWGNYQPNKTGQYDMNSSEYPYVDQQNADTYAKVWTLNRIKLPSGGEVRVEYEADDYAFVQDRRAMAMQEIVWVGENAMNTNVAPTLGFSSNSKQFQYLYFEVADGIDTDQEVIDHYFKDERGKLIKDLYFRFLLNLKGNRQQNYTPYEYISGYASYDGAGYDASQNKGYVKVSTVDIADKTSSHMVSPIAQAGWHYMRRYIPRLALNQTYNEKSGVIEILKSIVAAFDRIGSSIKGIYKTLRDNNCALSLYVDGSNTVHKSFIRAYEPTKFKKGGGIRVKKVSMYDNWQALSGSNDQSMEYGQEYDYTTTDREGNVISSGVAAYEPQLGGEENPFREAITYSEKNKLVPDDTYFQEAPFGESFFPGPSVGYSKVTIRNLQRANVTKHATGKVEKEFYTAKDFPTLVRPTSVEETRHKPNPLFKILKIKSKEYMTVSQGYAIELNDMHGKPKYEAVYQEINQEEPISYVKYNYKTEQRYIVDPVSTLKSRQRNGAYVNGRTVTTLSNSVPAMDRNGVLNQDEMIGVEYDVVMDTRESFSQTMGMGVDAGLDAFLAAIIPVAIPSIFFRFSNEETRFRSIVATKVINRQGLLEETIAMDNGSVVSTKNKMYDKETGGVILTETINQFDDPIYSFNYPAYWGQQGMGPSYENLGIKTLSTVSEGILNQYLFPGDELYVMENGVPEKAWAIENPDAAGKVVLVNKDGAKFDVGTLSKVKVIRSGRRNQQGVHMGSISSLKDLMPADGQAFKVGGGDQILNAQAVEFSDEWRIFCECEGVKKEPSVNPYITGEKGNYRMTRGYAYLTDRTQSRLNNNVDVRYDGVYTQFSPFWTPSPVPGSVRTPYWISDDKNWQWTAEVTMYSPSGQELENRDPLDRYSSALFGYSNTLPMALSSNAKFKEIAFDSFEDYDLSDCKTYKFNLRDDGDKVTDEESHTGRNSIKLLPGESIEFKKELEECEDQE